MRTDRVALALFVLVADGALAHGPEGKRALWLERRPEGGFALAHLTLTGAGRQTALSLAAGPRLGPADRPLARSLGPMALAGIALSDREGPIRLEGEVSVRSLPGRVEVMVLVPLGSRGEDGLRLEVGAGSMPVEVWVVGGPGPRPVHPATAIELALPTPDR